MKKTKSKRHRIMGIVGWIIFLPTVCLLLLLTIVQGFFADQFMDIAGFQLFTISNTGSMEPDLRFNDLIVVRRVDFDSLEIGDFVTFKSTVRIMGETREIYITHQIIEIVENTEDEARRYRTQGTNPLVRPDRALLSEDGENSTNRFVGKVVFSSR
jgi:signal peptidase I